MSIRIVLFMLCSIYCLTTRPVLAETAIKSLLLTPNVLSSLRVTHRPVGSTTLRYLGLAIYDARLWFGTQDVKITSYDQVPLVLALRYHRALKGQLIAKRSIVEMQRIGSFDESQSLKWQKMMEKAFPNVLSGDQLIGIHDGNGQVRFYHNDKLTYQFTDKQFAVYFFGIWLSPRTSEPKARLALLGDTLS